MGTGGFAVEPLWNNRGGCESLGGTGRQGAQWFGWR